jgi:hypothetical protein
MRLLPLLLLISFRVAAANWYCTDVASERVGNMIRACGVGTGKDENEARNSAFNNAKVEFANICENSADCKNRKVTVNPQRTACETDKVQVKCYRLIEFTILDEIDRSTGLEAYNPKRLPEKIDSAETLKPFYYEQIADIPKAHKGQSLQEFLELFGEPETAQPHYGDGVQVTYSCKKVPFCEDKRLADATAYFSAEKKVTSLSNFHFKYTRVLAPVEVKKKINCGIFRSGPECL